MYKLFKKLAGISIFYSFANSIEALSPFLLAILLTRLLTPQDYGIWVLFVSLMGFLRPVVNLTIQDALKMRFYEMDEGGRAAFAVSAFYLSTVSALLLGTLAVVFADPLAAMLKFPGPWIVSIVLAAYLYANFYFVLTFNQFAEQRGRFIGLQLVQSLFGFGIIALLVYRDWSWQGVVLGKISGLVIACVVGVASLAGDLRLRIGLPRKSDLKDMVRFGLVYLPTGFGLVAVPLTDRLIISHVLGFDENGLYGVAALFGSALFVGINGFLHAWMPWLFQRLGRLEKNYRKEVSAVSFGFMVLLPVMGLVFFFVSRIAAPFLIGEAFASSFSLIPWAIAGTVSMGYFYHNQAFLHFRKAVLPMSISSLVCIVMNAVLSYYGAIYYGVTGVLAATIGAFMISAIISGAYMILRYNVLGSLLAFARSHGRSRPVSRAIPRDHGLAGTLDHRPGAGHPDSSAAPVSRMQGAPGPPRPLGHRGGGLASVVGDQDLVETGVRDHFGMGLAQTSSGAETRESDDDL